MVTRCYSGKPMRVLRNTYVENWEKRSSEIRPFPLQFVESGRQGVLSYGEDPVDPARTCMPAGQGVGGIEEILPVAEIMRRLVEGAHEEIKRLAALRSDLV